jgi:hypothetical protein
MRELLEFIANILCDWPVRFSEKPITDKRLAKAEYRPIFNIMQSEAEQLKEGKKR